jgi:uncharacterized protein YndB with AHSA1/START domain/DNA-binding transcriptional ArsR family regulator
MTDDDRVPEGDRVFKALADPTRRFLLDLLFARDGRTLTELESELEMSRFGVMKHLRVLEDADLVVTRRSGREKLHFLNAVPIRQIHDRWIDKYTEQQVAALTDLKLVLEEQTMATTTETTVQVHRIYIQATSAAVWEAIIKPEWSEQYMYEGRVEYDLRPGGRFRGLPSESMRKHGEEMGYPIPDVCLDGEVIEVDPPRKLVQTWRMLMDPGMAEEGFTRLTWELEEIPNRPKTTTKLTVTHDVTGAPKVAALIAGEMESEGAGGGWTETLSTLKSVLEAA